MITRSRLLWLIAGTVVVVVVVIASSGDFLKGDLSGSPTYGTPRSGSVGSTDRNVYGTCFSYGQPLTCGAVTSSACATAYNKQYNIFIPEAGTCPANYPTNYKHIINQATATGAGDEDTFVTATQQCLGGLFTKVATESSKGCGQIAGGGWTWRSGTGNPNTGQWTWTVYCAEVVGCAAPAAQTPTTPNPNAPVKKDGAWYRFDD